MGAMATLLDRTRVRTAGSPPGDDARPLPACAAIAAAWAAGAGLVVCVAIAVVGWLVGSTGTAADAVRVGVQSWLLGQGAGLRVGPVMVEAIPLGLTLLSAFLLFRASRWAAARACVDDPRSVASGTAIVAALYATTAMAGALLTSGESAGVSPMRAFVAGLVGAVASAGPGMLRGSGVSRETWAWLPEQARAALWGGAAGAVAAFATGALLVTVALVADFGAAANVADALGAGVVGGAILVVIGALLLPNAALFGVAYMLGPGFVFGAGTTVAPSGVTLGRVPAFPLLAALPAEGPSPWWTSGLLALPVLAGALAAVVALRHHPVAGPDRGALRGGLAGLVAGLVTGASTALAGGSIGPGRMAETGAQVLACTGLAAAAMACGGAVAGLLVGWRLRRPARDSG
jgi:hypothetical protein